MKRPDPVLRTDDFSCPLMCSILKKRRVARLNQQEVSSISRSGRTGGDGTLTMTVPSRKMAWVRIGTCDEHSPCGEGVELEADAGGGGLESSCD